MHEWDNWLEFEVALLDVKPSKRTKKVVPYLKACLISCSMSSPLNLSLIMMTNSEKSNFPLWSTSISFMMFKISSSVGFRPRVRIRTPSSLAEMYPSPFCKHAAEKKCNWIEHSLNKAISLCRREERPLSFPEWSPWRCFFLGLVSWPPFSLRETKFARQLRPWLLRGQCNRICEYLWGSDRRISPTSLSLACLWPPCCLCCPFLPWTLFRTDTIFVTTSLSGLTNTKSEV